MTWLLFSCEQKCGELSGGGLHQRRHLYKKTLQTVFVCLPLLLLPGLFLSVTHTESEVSSCHSWLSRTVAGSQCLPFDRWICFGTCRPTDLLWCPTFCQQEDSESKKQRVSTEENKAWNCASSATPSLWNVDISGSKKHEGGGKCKPEASRWQSTKQWVTMALSIIYTECLFAPS